MGMLLQVWGQNFDKKFLQCLVVDEEGFLSEMFLMAMIANVPNIERVLVNGDYYHLPPYTGAFPNKVMYLGYDETIEKLIDNPVFRYLSLSKNFSSHTALVEALLEPSYGRQLAPGRTMEKRRQWRILSFPTPNDSLLILTSQTNVWEQLNLGRSWSDDLYNEVDVWLRKSITDKIPTALMVILCYYSASVVGITRLDHKSQGV